MDMEYFSTRKGFGQRNRVPKKGPGSRTVARGLPQWPSFFQDAEAEGHEQINDGRGEMPPIILRGQ
jgi:hypothetical protein